MFEDITLKRIPAKNVDRPFASGGFGAVYKVKHPFVSFITIMYSLIYVCILWIQDSRKYAALKCFTKPFIIDQQDLTIQDLTKIYADIRLEVNKLTSVDHLYIVHFLGLCVISFSFLLEWAPRGDLDQIIDKYQDAEFPICPDTVATTVLQVNILCVYT